MCGRRIGDIACVNSDVALVRAPRRVGIPHGTPKGPRLDVSHAQGNNAPRNANARIFVDESGDRFRVHEHKRGGRGPLDRTITATTLEKMYADAVASDQREVALR
jgi:hypothetical protein